MPAQPHECPMCGQDERQHKSHDALLNALRPFADWIKTYDAPDLVDEDLLTIHVQDVLFHSVPTEIRLSVGQLRTAYRVFKEYE